jgi:hypothetical protein
VHRVSTACQQRGPPMILPDGCMRSSEDAVPQCRNNPAILLVYSALCQPQARTWS